MAIVEGILPSHNLESVLLDTDYLCLIVAPSIRLHSTGACNWKS